MSVGEFYDEMQRTFMDRVMAGIALHTGDDDWLSMIQGGLRAMKSDRRER